ncbi:MAG: hypothetical protein ACK55Z_15705 [bacterium]
MTPNTYDENGTSGTNPTSTARDRPSGCCTHQKTILLFRIRK